MIRIIEVEFLADDDAFVSWRVFKAVNVILGDEKGFLLGLHADKVDAQFIDDGGLVAVEGRKAG